MTTTPVLASTWSFGHIGHDAAWPALDAGGSASEAVAAALLAVELDPRVDSVGVGGIPDASGTMALDSAIMRSPGHWAAVCGVRSTGAPSTICAALLDDFDRALRVGEGADTYARARGITLHDPWSDVSRAFWARHASRIASPHRQHPFTIPIVDDDSGALFPTDERQWSRHDTIGVLALDRRGDLCAGTSTSGIPLKPVGRVGDSAIIGQGLYVLPGVAAAVATGTGELIASTCLCFDVVSRLHAGAAPVEALRAALAFCLSQMTPRPHEQIGVTCLTAAGVVASGALRPGYRTAVRTSVGPGAHDTDCVLLMSEDQA
ncbi:MAG: isoaspartyl peptidase/L-asparaginase [Phycisphaerales bacterium]|nr:isoaspartyl peptidase/L-asparaginase [Phycisphaerales bacterium]